VSTRCKKKVTVILEKFFCLKKNVTLPLETRYTNKVNSFKKFYSDNRGRFFGYLLRRTGDYYLAADILQESFTRYFERYGKQEPSILLLFTIGRNLLNDNSRKQRSFVPFEEDQHRSSSDVESAFQVR
jgi:DNA-directed RNA polymerase specialized sigma24 family protein